MTATGASSETTDTAPRERVESGSLLTLCLLTHAPLLLLDGVFWDGWILEGRISSNDYQGFAQFYSEVGMPEFAPLHWALGTFAFPLGHRIAALLAAVTVTLSARSIALTLIPGRDRRKAWWLAALLCASPGVWTSMPEVSITTYFVFLSAFFLGTAVLLRGYDQRSPAFIAVGHLLLMGSFAFPSLVPYSITVGLAVLAQAHNRSKKLDWSAYLAAAVPPASAVLFFLLHRQLAPPHGAFAGYNTPGISLGAGGFVTLFARQLQYVLFSFYDAAFSHALGSVIEVAVVGLLLWRLFPLDDAGPETDKRLLWLGLFLVALGAGPYAAVNKGPNMAVGWETRHAILASIGLAVLALGVTDRLGAKMRGPVRALLVVVGISFVFSNYLGLQARHARDLALSNALARTNLEPRVAIWVHDDFRLWSAQPFINTELAALHRLSTGKMDRVLFDVRERGQLDFIDLKKHWTALYSMRDAECPEAWAELLLKPGRTQYSEAEIAIRYWVYKFVWRGRMSAFLDGLVDISVGAPRPDPVALKRCTEA